MSVSPYKSKKYLHLTVNLLLFAAVFGLISIVFIRFFSDSPNERKLTVSDQLILEGVEETTGEQNIFLFLYSDCIYCTKSIEFYKDLLNESKNKDINITAVFPKTDKNFTEYLNKFEFKPENVVQTSFSKTGIKATPTFVLTDKNNSIQKIWVGYLTFKNQNDVRKKLGLKPLNRFIEQTDLENLLGKNEKINVIDIRDRNFYARKHFPGAVNIPLDELAVRAINELDKTLPTAIYGTFDNDNDKGFEILSEQNFKKIYILKYKFSD